MGGVGGWQGMGGVGSVVPFNKSVYERWGAFFLQTFGYARENDLLGAQFPSAFLDAYKTK
jgi:hypothetical protein